MLEQITIQSFNNIKQDFHVEELSNVIGKELLGVKNMPRVVLLAKMYQKNEKKKKISKTIFDKC